ncbi:MAG TPA: putative Ig domain-containing protein [Longimicrobium sp.]|nr:putative Ig domain-containing protein [Longimicrobium sp.]
MKRLSQSLLLLAACAAGLVAPRAHAQQQPLRGWLHVVWDGERTPQNPDGVELYLVDAGGRGARLLLDGAGQRDRLVPLDRHRVEVSGVSVAGPRGPAVRVGAVRDVEPARAVQAASAVQPAPFITLLCKFADDPSEPFGTADAERLLGPTYPGMANYFGELAQDPGVLDGSAVAGWFTLPLPRSGYVSNNSPDLGAVVRDCVAAADPTVDFLAFKAVNLQLNGSLNIRSTPPYDTLSYGGSWTVTADGQTRQMGMTWLSRLHMGNYTVYPHEMGHALGWPHSSGPYGQVYDSKWDVMSVGYLHWTQAYGWLTIHTLAWHKDIAGWIPAARRWEPGSDTRETAVLERSALPGATGYLIARIPLADGSFYTAEARRVAGYDTPLPGEAVLLNHVMNGRAFVVDSDNNGNPNDEGAMWRVGETFTDAANGVSLRVDGQTATGFTVTITRGQPVVIASDSVLSSGIVGVPYADTLRASGGAGAITWSLSAGTLPAGLTLDPATGVVSGNPQGAGVFHFTARAAAGTATALLGARVSVVPRLAITGDSLRRAGVMGAAYADTLRADGAGAGASWAVPAGALPAGLTLDAATGALTGFPSQAGSFTFTASVTAAGQEARKTFSVAVTRPQLQAAAVLDQLIGTAALTADQARYLDLLGNRNGRVDVGDVRAWLVDNQQLTAAQAAELNAVIRAMDPRPAETPAPREKD